MVLFRILPRRTAGELTSIDLVFLFLITEAASNSLGEFASLTDGTIQILTMVALNWTMTRLSVRFPWFERLIEHSPLVVVRNGHMLRRHMRREGLSEEELMELLRLEGVERLDQVRIARLEDSGKLSVIRRRGDHGDTEIAPH